ncbi:hypothetical protein EDD18DRAFT_1157060 [Armillaria luteobubalina]|uniref:Uncharacterized protein n=1 Tax=Armillaria luteobubalina TaxID=153913 RepID=A0AA39UUT2_9AGAR|nr:hypothetical protein EDD18DRAFT_1157060 [Armillaria luteobubalina]
MLPVDKHLTSHRNVRCPALLLVTWSMQYWTFPLRLFSADLSFTKDCTPAQCCTSSFENNYVSCIECVGSAANVTDFSQFQTIVDQLVVLCSANGIAIPKVTFPGQDPNRQLSTSAIPSSTSGAASGTSGGSSTSISHSTISDTSVITTVSSQTSASISISSISRSTITSIAPASSVSVTERSSAPVSSASTTLAASGTAPAPAGTADSAVAMESNMLWMVPALVTFFFSA